MKYAGVIIEESLRNLDVLRMVKILDQKVERVTEHHKTPWIKQWTLDTVEINENQADEVAEAISEAIDTSHNAWYADYKNQDYHYIIYPGKVFKVNLHNPVMYAQAKAWGITLGIPEYQVDFAPDDKQWER